MSKNRSWKGTGPSKDQKFACSDNAGQIFGTKYPVKLDRNRKVWHLFLRVF